MKTHNASFVVSVILAMLPYVAFAQGTDPLALRQNTLAEGRHLKSIFKIDEAIDTLSTLVGSVFDEEVIAELADCHYQNGDYEGAAGTYFLLVSKCPGNILYRVRQASLMYRMKAFKQAAVEGKAILQIDSIPAIMTLVGDSYNQLEKYDSALVYYKRSLARRPANENVVSKAAKIYLGQKDYDSAIEMSEAFLQLSPDNFTVAPVKGLALYLKGDYEPAIEVFESQLQLGNENYGIHYNLGQCYWRTKVLNRAREELEKAWQIDSTDVNLAISIASVNADSYLPFDRDVKPWLDKALDMLEPDHSILSHIHHQYGLGYYKKQNSWDLAIEHYKLAYEYDPKLISALSTIAYCYEQKKDYKTALRWYEQYLQFAKPDSKGYNFAKQSVDYLKSELFMSEPSTN